MKKDITLQDMYLARRRIASVAQRTRLVFSSALTSLLGVRVYLKPEIFQETGSFKIRGAANKILSLSEAERAKGVITASTGNHGRAVAYVASELGVRAIVCVSEKVPANKVDALQSLGAKVVVSGRSQDSAFDKVGELCTDHEYMLIPPFDDPEVIAGQGIVGLEVVEELPQVGTVLVPVSGGGLISGIAKALKSASEEIKIIGVSMERAPVMYHSIQAGRPLQMDEEETLADSLCGGIGLANQFTFSMVQAYVDDIVLVSEAEIAAGMRYALEKHHFILEGAGAVGIAALLHEKVGDLRSDVVVVLSGGNVDLATLLNTLDSDRNKT